MKHRRITSLMTLVFLLTSFFLNMVPPVSAQDWQGVSPDIDGDGLHNAVETAGWYNGAGGPYITDPLDPDSDNDGLNDGEEKLLESDPTSDASPGIYVFYEDSFKTRKYYPWQQYGHKLIARGDDFDPPNPDEIDIQKGHGTDLDAIVVRRGTTFYVGGPTNATLQYQKSDGSLDNLTINNQDPFSGHWQVTVPSTSGGTVGKYTLTLNGKSMDLFVIFELPTASGELTSLGIEKFLYNDDPSQTSDKYSILIHDDRYPGDERDGITPPYSIPSGEYVTDLKSYEYRNDQYNRYLLEDYVIETINGETSQRGATEALTDKVDQETVFRNPHPRTDSRRVLHPGSNPRQQCSNVAGLLSAFSRAAGIASRPIVTDWRSSTFDHANEIWLDDTWMVYRGYKYAEIGYDGDDEHYGCDDPEWPACGTRDYYTRYSWGKNRYKPWHSGGHSSGTVLVLADENWSSDGLGARQATWDINKILLRPERFVTVNSKYWGHWGVTQEPVDYGTPYYYGLWPDLPPDKPTNVSAVAVAGTDRVTISWDNNVSGPTVTSYNIYYRKASSVSKVSGTQIANVTSSYDVISLTVGALYSFRVTAVGPTGESVASSKVQAIVQPPPPTDIPTNVTANPGDQQVTVSWSPVTSATSYNFYYQPGSTVSKATGTQITGATSPEVVTSLSNDTLYAFGVTAIGSSGESDLSNVVTAMPEEGLGLTGLGLQATSASDFDFQSPEVQLGNIVNEYGVDLNGNGRYDQLVLEVEVTATQPGNYWLLGQLSATQPSINPRSQFYGGVIAEALGRQNIVEGSQIVQLVFGGVEIALSGVNGPYNLNGLWITDVEEPAPELVDESLAYRENAYVTAPYQANNFEDHGATLSHSYSHYNADSDGDGNSDSLMVTTSIKISEPGVYTVQGALYDNQNQFVSHATWSGTNPEVTLQFNNVSGNAGPFTLQDLELLNDDSQGIDYVPGVAYTIDPITALTSPDIISMEIYPDGLMTAGEGITPTTVFNESLVDGNLKIDAEVEVSTAGSYKLEAWLADSDGNLVTWANGQPTNLTMGIQTLSLTFAGGNIRARGVDGPYTVVALKVLKGDTNYEVLDKVDIALTTQAYTVDQFAIVTNGNTFEDYVENGGSQWSPESRWTIEKAIHQYIGPSNAWYGTNANASLTLTSPLDISEAQSLYLKFHTSHNFGDSGGTGYVEVSTDGNTWDTVATFAGNNISWSDQIQTIDLENYIGEPSFYLRFRLASAGGASDDGWYVDDIIIATNVSGGGIYLPIIFK